MVKSQNNPYVLLETEGISKSVLSEKAVKMLELYDRATRVSVNMPKSKELQAQAEKAGDLACSVIRQDLERIKKELKNDVEDFEKKTTLKAQSRKIIQKSEQVFDDLALCREKLKKDRKQKMESGEIAAPKKKTLVTKLRGDLSRIVGLIPAKLKENTDVIERTEKAVLKFLSELKDIWGMTRVKAIEEGIAEKISKLQEQAE